MSNHRYSQVYYIPSPKKKWADNCDSTTALLGVVSFLKVMPSRNKFGNIYTALEYCQAGDDTGILKWEVFFMKPYAFSTKNILLLTWSIVESSRDSETNTISSKKLQQVETRHLIKAFFSWQITIGNIRIHFAFLHSSYSLSSTFSGLSVINVCFTPCFVASVWFWSTPYPGA